MADYTISAYLDTRRKKTNDLYPVKVRVYHDYNTRFYPTGINLTEQDFERSYQAEKPRAEYKDLKLKILSSVARAKGIADELKQFDFEKFEKRLLRPSTSGTDVFYHYAQTVNKLKSEDRISTASNYDLSAKSIKNFLLSKKRKADHLPFDAITPVFLQEYEKWMLSVGKGKTTVGIYLRPLRAIFNQAINDGEITKDLYPFGKRKYQIPQGRNIKKALSKEDLKKLFEYELPEDSYMAKARDFFFFSYVTNGINIKDIAGLRYKDLTEHAVSFIRSKTMNTTKGNSKPIVAALAPFSRQVIEKHGNKKQGPETLVFPIVKPEMSEEQKHRAVQAFTRFINQHIKKLAKLVGVEPNISTYFARHSFTTSALQSGATFEYIQDSLGHASPQTTMNYWKGFSDNIKKEVADKLMDFSA